MIAEWLTIKLKETIFIHLNVHNSYNNILEETEKIKQIVENDFDTNTFFRAMDIINDKKKMGR